MMASKTTVSPASNVVPAIVAGGLSGLSWLVLAMAVGANTNETNPGVLRTVRMAGGLVTVLPGLSRLVTTTAYWAPLPAPVLAGVV